MYTPVGCPVKELNKSQTMEFYIPLEVWIFSGSDHLDPQ